MFIASAPVMPSKPKITSKKCLSNKFLNRVYVVYVEFVKIISILVQNFDLCVSICGGSHYKYFSSTKYNIKDFIKAIII